MKNSSSTVHREASSRARERLAELGHKESSLSQATGLMRAIELEIGAKRNCSPQQWVRRYLTLTNAPIVRPRVANKLKSAIYEPSAQWGINVERARRAQPSRWTPDSVGNGPERQHGYGRGS